LVGVFAALYASLVYALPSISFMAFNVRVADALRGLIPYFGYTSIVGIAIGHFIANLQSPLGPIDLVSVPIAFAASCLTYVISKRSLVLCFVPIWLSLSLWVSYMLSLFTGIDYVVMLVIICPQVFVSDYVLPLALAYAFKRVHRMMTRGGRGLGRAG